MANATVLYFDTIYDAQAKADDLNAAKDGNVYIAYGSKYNGARVAALPKVGDKVSGSFNGDSYPAGKIVKVSATYFRITTDTGVTFTRVGPMVWRNGGKKGTWTMIKGYVSKQNPHF